MIAYLNLRHGVAERMEAYTSGLKKHGYTVQVGFPTREKAGDVFVTWNRIGSGNVWAKRYQKAGNRVLVTENSTWGNSFAGERWYHMARDFHNTAGCVPVGESDRWDSLEVALEPWRDRGGETVILPQRGIGSNPTKMPQGFTAKALRKHRGRVRKHPGTRHAKPIMQDLRKASRVVTWGSGAAVIALMHGVRVSSYMPNWIGEQDNTDEGRLSMFRSLAWAQWRLEEISSGYAFDRLL
jgi:hypothetical protein